MEVEYFLSLVAKFEVRAKALLKYRPESWLQRIIVRIMEIMSVRDLYMAGTGDYLARIDICHATVPPLIA
jgi:hypothetical protein